MLFESFAISLQVPDVPTMIEGEPGIGKTKMAQAIVKSLAERTGDDWTLATKIGSLYEPSEILGFNVYDPSKGKVIFAPADYLVEMSKKKYGVIFYDEFNNSPRAVIAVQLRVIQEGIVEDSCDVSHIKRLAAMNPIKSSVGGQVLPAPTSNRLAFLYAKQNPDNWIKGYLSGFKTPDFPVLPNNWRDNIEKVKPLIAGFINSKRQALHMLPESDSGKGQPWPSGRSWDNLGIMLGACNSVNAPQEVKIEICSGCVGKVATEFFNWVEEADLPDTEYALNNPDKFTEPAHFKLPDRADIAFTFLASIVSAYKSKPTEKRWLASWQILGCAGRFRKDIGTLAALQLSESFESGMKMPPAKDMQPFKEVFNIIDAYKNK